MASLKRNERLWPTTDGASMKGMAVESAQTPAFIVQKEVVERNCQNMLATCRDLGVRLRVQTKTHKTIEGVRLQTGGTMRGLVCSTLTECEYFGQQGCDDILLGHPALEAGMGRVRKLVSYLEDFHLMVDDVEAVTMLVEQTPPQGKRWSVFLKVDCGKGRAGVWHEDVAAGAALVRLLCQCPHLVFRGVYVHCGDTYAATSAEQLHKTRDDNIARILEFVDRIKESTGHPCPSIGVGSTPSCRQPCSNMARLSELHPGNYVFLDIQQHLLGSCSLDDIAVSVATRVMGHYPRRNQLLIDCGFTALTKQGWGKMDTGYGVIKGHPHLKLCAMDQEHGFVEPVNKQDKLDYSKYPVGSLLYILPYHSCATAAMFSEYLVVDGDIVVDVWKPVRGW